MENEGGYTELHFKARKKNSNAGEHINIHAMSSDLFCK